jgi:hypothetical protein
VSKTGSIKPLKKTPSPSRVTDGEREECAPRTNAGTKQFVTDRRATVLPYQRKEIMKREMEIPQEWLDFARGYFMGRIHSHDDAERDSIAYNMGWELGEDDYNVHDAGEASQHTIAEYASL